MQSLDAAAPPAQPAAPAAEAPPTIRNAGRLSPEGDSLTAVLLTVAMLVLLVGAMVQAVMTSQRRATKGLAFGAAYGAVALVALLAVDGGFLFEEGLRSAVFMLMPMLALWLVLALAAFVVGTVLKAPSPSRKADVF